MLKKLIKRVNKKLLLGVSLLLAGVVILLLTYWPILSAYISFYSSPEPSTTNIEIAKDEEEVTKKITKTTEKVVIDADFGIYIPKIKSNSKVVKNINPFDEAEYSKALETDVVHTKGTATPDMSGNVFLFAHSAVNFYERNKFHVYFYLLSELKAGDEIFVSYEKNIYKYKVVDVKIVNKEEVKYLRDYDKQDTLTLMTCYPAGSDWKRSIVIAHRDELAPILNNSTP